jgi:TusA-related sulfurtransferase
MRDLLRFKQLAQPNKEKYDHEYACRLLMESPERHQSYLQAFTARKPEILPKLLITTDCPGIIDAIPTAIHEEGTEDVLKTETQEDDRLDGARYTLNSQRVSDIREPIEVFRERHFAKYTPAGHTLSVSDKIWMAMVADAEYEKSAEDMRPFRVPAASSSQRLQ